jgi:hypothetical protein
VIHGWSRLDIGATWGVLRATGESMRNQSTIRAILLLIAIVGIAGVSLGYLLQQEPDYYVKEWTSPPDTDDSVIASNVLTKLDDLMNDLQDNRHASWSSSYSAEELNSFFRERRSGKNALITGLLGDVPEPRFAIRDDRLFIAFRYGEGTLSTVISIEVKVWLVKDQPNLVAIAVVGFQAGSLPMPKYLILDRFAQMARKHNAEVNWYRHNGQPVALCQLYANQSRPDSQIDTLKIAEGRIIIGGKHSSASLPLSITP